MIGIFKMVEQAPIDIARTLHGQGLTQALLGDFPKAHDSFEAAITTLEGGYSRDPDNWVPRVTIVASNVGRDDGFTYVRQGVRENSAACVVFGIEEMTEAHDLTARVSLLGQVVTKAEGAAARRERGDLLSAHAATLGLGATAVAAWQLMTESEGTPTVDGRYKEGLKQLTFAQAHAFGREGADQYYVAANSLRAARVKRAQGVGIHAILPEIGQVLGAIKRSLRSGNRGFGRSLLTFARQALTLRSPKTARNSLLNWHSL